MKFSRTLVVLFSAALLAIGAGCGDDSSQSNNGGTNNGGADAGPEPDTSQSEIPQDWTYSSEYYLRFTGFAFDSSSPGSRINGLLNQRIQDQSMKYPVAVLIHLRDIDIDAGTVDIRGGAGLKVDLECDPEVEGECAYKFDPEQTPQYTEGAPFDGETGMIDGSLELLNFVATFELNDGIQKATVPIRGIEFTGRLLPEATTDDNGEVVVEVGIADGDLSGYVTEEEADNTEIQLFPEDPPVKLSQLLEKGEMNLDLDEDGTNDAWQLEATFEAHQTTVIEE